MRNVLFVWSKQHPETKYRQGMHDILGKTEEFEHAICDYT